MRGACFFSSLKFGASLMCILVRAMNGLKLCVTVMHWMRLMQLKQDWGKLNWGWYALELDGYLEVPIAVKCCRSQIVVY